MACPVNTPTRAHAIMQAWIQNRFELHLLKARNGTNDHHASQPVSQSVSSQSGQMVFRQLRVHGSTCTVLRSGHKCGGMQQLDQNHCSQQGIAIRKRMHPEHPGRDCQPLRWLCE